MGYVQFDLGVADFRKATFAFYVGITQEAADAVAAQMEIDSNSYPLPPLSGVLPIMVMGHQGSTKAVLIADGEFLHNLFYVHHKMWLDGQWVDDRFSGYNGLFTNQLGPEQDVIPTNPSYIGIDCSNPAAPRLCFNFETNTQATRSGITFVTTGATADADRIDYYLDTGGSSPTPPDPPTFHTGYTVEDVTGEGYATGAYKGKCLGAVITPGVWHHVIISLDVSAGCVAEGIAGTLVTTGYPDLDSHNEPPGRDTTTAYQGITEAGKLYIAIDDVNLTGTNLYDLWPGGGDPNMLITSDALTVATMYNWANQTSEQINEGFAPWWRVLPAQEVTITGMTAPSYAIDEAIATSGIALGIPATAAYADRIQDIKLAHFQVFLGDTLNTTNRVERSIFIDDNGEATDPSVAIEYFGRQPNIAFHAGTDWVTGTNVGSEGEFTVVGHPLKSGPNPKIGA